MKKKKLSEYKRKIIYIIEPRLVVRKDNYNFLVKYFLWQHEYLDHNGKFTDCGRMFRSKRQAIAKLKQVVKNLRKLSKSELLQQFNQAVRPECAYVKK